MAVPPEHLVYSINRYSSATAGIRSRNLATFSMRGNHLAYVATQGMGELNERAISIEEGQEVVENEIKSGKAPGLDGWRVHGKNVCCLAGLSKVFIIIIV